MKRNMVLVASGVALCAAAVITVFSLGFRAEAQRSSGSVWEYAAVTGSYIPYPVDSPESIATVAVNVCFVQQNGCRNEEVVASVSYAKFFQDNRLENNETSRGLARNRARDDAFAKAIAKLGLDGWELAGPPGLQFDTAYANPRGTTSFNQGNQERKDDIYFKRRK